MNTNIFTAILFGVLLGFLGTSFYHGYKRVEDARGCTRMAMWSESTLASNRGRIASSGAAMAVQMRIAGESDPIGLAQRVYVCRQNLTDKQFKVLSFAMSELADSEKKQ